MQYPGGGQCAYVQHCFHGPTLRRFAEDSHLLMIVQFNCIGCQCIFVAGRTSKKPPCSAWRNYERYLLCKSFMIHCLLKPCVNSWDSWIFIQPTLTNNCSSSWRRTLFKKKSLEGMFPLRQCGITVGLDIAALDTHKSLTLANTFVL